MNPSHPNLRLLNRAARRKLKLGSLQRGTPWKRISDGQVAGYISGETAQLRVEPKKREQRKRGEG